MSKREDICIQFNHWLEEEGIQVVEGKTIVLFLGKVGSYRTNSTLQVIGKHPSGLCECGSRETVEHVLIHCDKYSEEKQIN